jgi:hypothetical protein
MDGVVVGLSLEATGSCGCGRVVVFVAKCAIISLPGQKNKSFSRTLLIKRLKVNYERRTVTGGSWITTYSASQLCRRI